MLSGALYDASDPALAAARVRARRLTQRFNSLDPADTVAIGATMRELLGEMGEGAWIEAPFYCDYGEQIRLGARAFINFGCILLDCAAIEIGDDAQLGPGVQLLTSDHPRGAEERAAGLESAKPITIGEGAWLGGGVIVLPGVEIGAGAIVGAGSVVTRSVEPRVTVAGNPCRVISGR
ncbi:MAG: maltose acetyltransferase [Actinobacteria bacterium HGW-Actinobacteria-7]|nr:MAG: maltose acetyltransferase [Actinobacteria bacterium HGW-Actinobacteria-7]